MLVKDIMKHRQQLEAEHYNDVIIITIIFIIIHKKLNR
jgi:hypothetical protein